MIQGNDIYLTSKTCRQSLEMSTLLVQDLKEGADESTITLLYERMSNRYKLEEFFVSRSIPPLPENEAKTSDPEPMPHDNGVMSSRIEDEMDLGFQLANMQLNGIRATTPTRPSRSRA